MIMTHTRINKTTVKYSSVNDVINKANLTVMEHYREVIYVFDGGSIVPRTDSGFTQRDGFIETLSHVSECTICLTDYYVQCVIQYYVNVTSNPYRNQAFEIHNLYDSLTLKCSRAHDKVSYLD